MRYVYLVVLMIAVANLTAVLLGHRNYLTFSITIFTLGFYTCGFLTNKLK